MVLTSEGVVASVMLPASDYDDVSIADCMYVIKSLLRCCMSFLTVALSD